MSSIKSFIQNEVLQPRLKQAGVLVVYDPAGRYRELCLELASDKYSVVDASESSIESREQALATLQSLGEPGTSLERMLIYVPTKAAVTETEQQRDPFAMYVVCGGVFPESDGDDYENLCLKAKSDHATEIRQIFRDNPNPDFAVIDAIGVGGGWPTLQASLKVESARDILFALLAPSEQQSEALKANDAWISEAKYLFRSCLGLKLLTRGKTWAAIADELWRFVLYSEFVFDLPEQLPAGLGDVPRAEPVARYLVEDVCERLRNDRRTQGTYIERAEHIEQELNLPTTCHQITDLGLRDTFPFEERSFFHQAVAALKRDDIDQVREVLSRHVRSVWLGKGESQAQWTLLQAAVSLVEACQDADRQLPDYSRSQQVLIDFYLRSLRDVDRLQREFEQAAGDHIDAQGSLQEVKTQAQSAYRSLVEKVQSLFVKHLESSGWPPAGLLANADVFDKIDALRYELGIALEKQLLDDGTDNASVISNLSATLNQTT